MIESIRKMWRITEIRKKLIYTFLMLVLFRLVGVIPAPGVDAATWNALAREYAFLREAE